MRDFSNREAIKPAKPFSEISPLLGYIQTTRGTGDAVLSQVARMLMSQELNIHGAIQLNTQRSKDQRCDMDMVLWPSGQTVRISQSLGSGAHGCRIDGGALENAVAALSSTFGAHVDLLIINKFGKTEAEGGGFRELIAEAVALGVPVLTCVNALNRSAFLDFAAGFQVELKAERAFITNWCVEMLTQRYVG